MNFWKSTNSLILLVAFSQAASGEALTSFNYGQKANVCRDWAVSAAQTYGSYAWAMKEYDLLKQHYKTPEERYQNFEDVSKFKNDVLIKELQPLTAIYHNISCPKDGLIYSFSCVDGVISALDKAQANYLVEIEKGCTNKIGRYIYESYEKNSK